MAEQELEERDTLSNVKTHEQIQALLDEIKEFENTYPGYKIIEPETVEEHKETDEDLDIDQDKGIITRKRKFSAIRIRRRKKTKTIGETIEPEQAIKTKKRKKKTPTSFNIGFDENGKLVNLDLRKPKVKPKSESKLKKIGFLKKFSRGKKGEKTESEGSEKKATKAKGRFGKIGNLKKAIPFKSKKKEKRKEE